MDDSLRMISSTNYQYYIKKDGITTSFDYLNSGKKSIAALEYKKNKIVVNVNTFNHFNEFLSRINTYSSLKNPNQSLTREESYNRRIDHIFERDNFIIIGESLANEYGLKIGDELKLSDIINVNPLTGFYHSEPYLISGIFSFRFINYDFNNVFIGENKNFFKNTNLNYYYDSNNNFHLNNYIENNTDIKSLLSAINLEKYIYVSLGGFVLLIATIMIFNNTLILLLEKRKQYKILYAQGISKKNILSTTLAIFLLISFFFSTSGYAFSLIIDFFNQKFNLLKYLFMYSPFDKVPIIISFDKYILNLTIVILLTLLAVIFAISKVNLDIEEL